MREETGTAAGGGRRVLTVACIVAIAAGCVFSLAGPAVYGEDVDRHLARVVLLLRGDLSQLVQGLHASGGHATLSGAFLGILAPAMAVSGRPEWLWTYLDLLILVGAVPLWYLARKVADAPLAWITVALYVTSSGRIDNSWLGIHSSVALAVVPLWHLAVLRLMETRRIRDAAGAAVLLFLLLSLHLSYLTMLLAVPLLVAWSAAQERPALARWTRLTPWRAVGVIGLGGVGFALAGRAIRGWDLDGASLAARNLAAAVGEHVGFVASRLRPGGWAYPPDHNPWLYVMLPLVLLGLVAAWAPWRWLQAPSGTRVRVGTVRAWLLVMLTAQLGGAWVGVHEWHVTPVNVMRFRHVTAIAPILYLLLAFAIVAVARLLGRAMRQRVPVPAVAAGLVVVLAAAHLRVLASEYRGRPWRIRGMALEPELQHTVAATRARWHYSEQWFSTAAFVDPAHTLLRSQPRWEYLVHWLFRHEPPPLRAPVGPELVMYLVVPGSPLERELLASQDVVDTVHTPHYVAYLCRRSPDRLLQAEPFYLTYGPRAAGKHLLLPPPGTLATVAYENGTERFPLIAPNVELPDEVGHRLTEVVIKANRAGLVLGARLYGRDFLRGPGRSGIEGAYVRVSGRDGQSVRVPLEPDAARDVRYLGGVGHLTGWKPEDVRSVTVGFDAYRVPANPWRRLPERTVVRPAVRIR